MIHRKPSRPAVAPIGAQKSRRARTSEKPPVPDAQQPLPIMAYRLPSQPALPPAPTKPRRRSSPNSGIPHKRRLNALQLVTSKDIVDRAKACAQCLNMAISTFLGHAIHRKIMEIETIFGVDYRGLVYLNRSQRRELAEKHLPIAARHLGSRQPMN